MRAASQRGVPRWDYLGYRVAEPTRAKWITVLRPRQTGRLARWPTVSGARPSRRRMLAAGATLLLAGPAVLTGCTPSALAPTGPDPLEAPARRAEADAALAARVAQTASHAESSLATVAEALAADRMAHARTLRTELRRARPEPATSSAPPPAAPPPANPAVADTRTALTQSVRAAQDEAAELVVTLPGYRAALLASITACCASHAALLS
jgi:hypothetical protein